MFFLIGGQEHIKEEKEKGEISQQDSH